VWISLLDCGFGVKFTRYEHEYTNPVHASQKTRITGPLAFRVVLQFLCFEPPQRRSRARCASQVARKSRHSFEQADDSSCVRLYAAVARPTNVTVNVVLGSE